MFFLVSTPIATSTSKLPSETVHCYKAFKKPKRVFNVEPCMLLRRGCDKGIELNHECLTKETSWPFSNSICAAAKEI